MMMGNRLMVMAAAIVVVIVILTHFLLFNALLQMHFGMSFLLIGSREFASACIALEGLFAGVGSKL